MPAREYVYVCPLDVAVLLCWTTGPLYRFLTPMADAILVSRVLGGR